MSSVRDDRRPRAVIHKRILDAAGERPEATIAGLADEIPGASPALVESVLERYGDPAEDATGTPTEENGPRAHQGSTAASNAEREGPDDAHASGSSDRDTGEAEEDAKSETTGPMAGGDDDGPSVEPTGRDEAADDDPTAAEEPAEETATTADPAPQPSAADTPEPAEDPDDGAAGPPDAAALSSKQLETLREIHARPDATQAAIGDALDVTAAAVSNRLRDIDGFDWDDRRAFVSEVVEPPLVGDGQGGRDAEPADAVEAKLDELASRVDALESQTDDQGFDAELGHKVVHACMQSDQFSEDEELAVIRAVFGSP